MGTALGNATRGRDRRDGSHAAAVLTAGAVVALGAGFALLRGRRLRAL